MKTLLSWRFTGFLKRVFPVLWFGTLAAFAVGSLVSGEASKDPLLVLVPVIIMVVGFVLMQALVWIAVDEVADLGDALLVRNRGKEQRLALTDIRRVDAATRTNPPRVTMHLERPGPFGERITFFTADGMAFNPFRSTVVGPELAARVKRAKDKPSKVKAARAAKAAAKQKRGA
jgi:hypothetical protein